MFDFIRFVSRNPSYITKQARRANTTRKAMNYYRASHTECAWCGRSKKLEVHHIIPVSVAPGLADQQSNMIMLCRKPACHQIVGHDGDFGRRYVANVREICEDDAQQVVSVCPTK